MEDKDKIHLITNIFKEEQRKQLVKDCKPLLWTPEELEKVYQANIDYAGKQTPSVMHTLPQFNWVYTGILHTIKRVLNLDLIVMRSWVNWSNGKKMDIRWHSHPDAHYSCVYYMKTFPLFSNGTLFRDQFIKSPQNSLILFEGHLEHTAPSSPLPFSRYTLALDLNRKG